MDPFRAKNAVPADYNPGAQDGSRPGHINVNEWDPEHRLTLNIEAIAYHEGVPGHHLQISIGQELKDLPAFRKNGDYTAFIEGWALYSERLGKEIGFYEDPYSDYGRLENEMWRAIRLVIDTGVHEKHWSRDRWWTSSIATPRWTSPMCKPKWTAILPGRDRPWPTSWDNWKLFRSCATRVKAARCSTLFQGNRLKGNVALSAEL